MFMRKFVSIYAIRTRFAGLGTTDDVPSGDDIRAWGRRAGRVDITRKGDRKICKIVQDHSRLQTNCTTVRT
jgi:hypothetical protein